MEKEKTKTLEREYIIPLRAKFRSVPRYKKSNKAVKAVKEFLARHMKVENRNLNNVKLDTFVNEAIWARGIKNPIHKIKVKAVKEGDIVRVTLVDVPKKMVARKKRVEKREAISDEKERKKKKEKIENEAEDKKNEKKNEEKVESKVEEKKEEVEKKETEKVDEKDKKEGMPEEKDEVKTEQKNKSKTKEEKGK